VDELLVHPSPYPLPIRERVGEKSREALIRRTRERTEGPAGDPRGAFVYPEALAGPDNIG